MKRKILNFGFCFLMLSFLFTACKKDAATDNAMGSGNNETASLRADAVSNISLTLKDVTAFKDEFSKMLSDAGINAKLPNITILTKLPVFNALNAALKKTGLNETLGTPGLNATVFAPTDAAFAQLPAPYDNAEHINAITDPSEIDFLTNVLLYHVVGATVRSNEIADGRSNATTLKPAGAQNDNTIYFSNEYGLLAINGNALVLFADIPASNGIVHVINKVLLPPTQTIVGIATADPSFTSLVAGLVKTDLAGLFDQPGDYTVFAPTDDAFAQLPEPFNTAANIAAINDQAQIDALANILKYHVLAERYFTLDLGDMQELTTLAAPPDNTVIGMYGLNKGFVKGNENKNYAKAYPANLLATNGVVHVMNQVLLP